MRHLRITALLAAIAATFLIATTASATVLTSPSGSTYTGTVKASDGIGQVSLHNNMFNVACDSSLEGLVESHGPSTTAAIGLSPSFSNCNQQVHVKVRKGGNLRAHALGKDAGTLTWDGMHIEVTFTSLNFTCSYGAASGTHAGTLTGSNITGGKAALDVAFKFLAQTGGIWCNGEMRLTGSYLVDTPETLNVD